MKIRERFLALFLIPLMLLSGCSETDSGSPASQADRDISSLTDSSTADRQSPEVKLDVANTVRLNVGETYQLEYKLTGSGSEVVFASSNTETAVVSESGLISAVGAGEASVTVSVKGAENVSVSVKVVVEEKAGASYGFYRVKDGVSDLSFLQGYPWLNTTVEGVMANIERPSLKDDFFAWANYEKLQTAKTKKGKEPAGGVYEASAGQTEKYMDEIYSGDNAVSALAGLVRKGDKEAVRADVSAAFSMTDKEIGEYFRSPEIFAARSKFFLLTHASGRDELVLSFPLEMKLPGFVCTAAITADMGPEVFISDLTNIAEAEGIEKDGLDKVISESVQAVVGMTDPIKKLNRAKELVTTVGELNRVFGITSLDLTAALKATGVSDSRKIVYHEFDAAYARQIDAMLKGRKTDALRNIIALGRMLDDRFLIGAEDYMTLSPKLYGVGTVTAEYPEFSEGTTQDEAVRAIVGGIFPEAVDRTYIDKFVTAESREKVRALVEDIRSQYKVLFRNAEWMSEKTVKLATEKLEAMHCTVFYEDEYIAVPPFVPEKDESLVEAYHSYIGYVEKNISLGNFVNDELSAQPCYSLNAVYSPEVNSYRICHGLLSSFIDDPGLTTEELYGRVGVTVGHEISHGFDSTGSLYDKNGKANDWWQPEDREEFDSKVQKLVDYVNSCVHCFDSIPMNGDHNSGEIIADMGGMRVMISLAEKLDGFDFDRFFTAFAEYYGWVNRKQDAEEYVESDAHPLSYLRVDLTLAQFPEFAQVYGIQPGDGMFLRAGSDLAVW